ncbi:MAG: tetratricopeptide repeat protein [Desulfocurvibacter africanus]
MSKRHVREIPVILALLLLAAAHACGYYRGNLALNRGDYREGVRLLEQAVAEHPDWANARIDLGRAYLYLGRDVEAKAQLASSAAMNPSEWRAVYYLAVADILDGQAAKGLARFDASLYPLELFLKKDILYMTEALIGRGLSRHEFLDAARGLLNEAERRQMMREMSSND